MPSQFEREKIQAKLRAERAKTAIELRKEGLTFREIGDRLGVSDSRARAIWDLAHRYAQAVARGQIWEPTTTPDKITDDTPLLDLHHRMETKHWLVKAGIVTVADLRRSAGGQLREVKGSDSLTLHEVSNAIRIIQCRVPAARIT